MRLNKNIIHSSFKRIHEKLLLELLTKCFASIAENWSAKLLPILNDKLSKPQIDTFVESSLNTFIEVIETGDYKSADQYLIDTYTLFSEANLNLLEVSQLYSQGRFAVLNFIENDAMSNTDPVILLGFLMN